MSDILIKNIEIPERCVDCRFCDEIDSTCIALNDNSTACITGKPKWCPLIEVPPHGDLIDRMALLESIKEARKKDPDVEDVYIDDYFIVAEWLMSAPAIIKEDGGT